MSVLAEPMTKVDVFVPRGDRLSAAQIARRQWLSIGGVERVLVLSPEDVILHKLRWYEAGQRVSGRQWRDVLGVLAVRRDTLDLDYLHRQAKDAGLAELLTAALAHAAPG